MLHEVLTYGFDVLHLHRIELVVFDFNKPAIACYEKAGFRAEGHLRDVVRIGDKYWNWILMSVLDHEFQSSISMIAGAMTPGESGDEVHAIHSNNSVATGRREVH